MRFLAALGMTNKLLPYCLFCRSEPNTRHDCFVIPSRIPTTTVLSFRAARGISTVLSPCRNYTYSLVASPLRNCREVQASIRVLRKHQIKKRFLAALGMTNKLLPYCLFCHSEPNTRHDCFVIPSSARNLNRIILLKILCFPRYNPQRGPRRCGSGSWSRARAPLQYPCRACRSRP